MKKKFLLFILVCLVSSCSFMVYHSINDTYNYDKKINFSTYKTFSFFNEEVKNTSEVSQLDINQIQDEIRDNLKKRYILEVEKNPDVLIIVQTYVKPASITSSQFGDINTDIKNHLFVILDMKDAKLNRAIWRGNANVPLPNNFLERAVASQEKVMKVLVKRILEKFPLGK